MKPNLVYMTLEDKIQDRDRSARRAAVTHLVDDQVRVILSFGQLVEVVYIKTEASTDSLYSTAESRFDIPDCDLFVQTSNGDFYQIPTSSTLDSIISPVPETVYVKVEDVSTEGSSC